MLSLKLAANNIKKGFKSFAPFLMASVTMFVMIFVTASIALSPSIHKLRGGSSLSQIMSFALIVLSIFAVLILIYSYRFLQTQRSKEFGLYDILGFGKTRIVGVAFLELLLSYIITVIVGTICGIAFSKFLFLVFVNMIGGNYFNLVISPGAIIILAILFFVFFLILMMIGVWIIWRSSSLDLLREESKGEKEPKSNLFFAIAAVILLGAGYYIALTVDNPISALLKFFIAVLLVIFGTYLFYISFTVWYLKLKKKRPSYYKPNNFITTSSMLYRMKANAVGLGNITILLSMTIVTVVVSLGVFLGTENMVKTFYTREAQVFSVSPNENREETIDRIKSAADSKKIDIDNIANLYYVQDLQVDKTPSSKDKFITSNKLGRSFDKDSYYATMTTIQSLQSLGNKKIPSLKDNQVLLIDLSKKNSSTINPKEVTWYGQTYEVKENLKSVKDFPSSSTSTISSKNMMIVFANDQAFEKALANFNKAISGQQGFENLANTTILFDLKPVDEKRFTKAFKEEFKNNKDLTISYRSEALQDQRAEIGGLVFVGFVLGISFILGAALIIYYKQLSEGAQDKRSFKILQEVGLSKEEVQKTIKSQVRMIFFLPLVITICHFAGAYLMIEKIIMLFDITDRSVILTISLVTIAILALIYYLIYKATSRVYYKIVER
ncbi:MULTISPECIES: FtsX-like permease family protein [Lactococcus]|jgi:Predicted membrane protein|uniref:Bacitracin export permease protein BceB n=1 Tax=Lactococcus lactis subsp. lactis TaxID=1360 RepID=A0A2N5WBA1_LACLL|nr:MULTISPECIES: FtsX-like permease family protein [Lactococcus]MDT3324630.1 FtsX-like permease family protein [Bacillota bacterium]KST79609.1 ABC transporter permease and substrate binding protein [Lactococcus lactis subsp. lactis]MBK0084085.1 FtsX-like permease family protein [Lactococcus sp. S64]MBR8679557.1 ABC transporter permease [Lactococcus lactis subsp. lactis]MBR8681917.1 ABC transporter permease [Lactococcus lactis subsp. lactis]